MPRKKISQEMTGYSRETLDDIRKEVDKKQDTQDTDVLSSDETAASETDVKRRKYTKHKEVVTIKPEDTVPLLKGLSVFIGNRLGDKWVATDSEASAIASALNRVLIKYAPVIGSHCEELALAAALVAYFLPRLSFTAGNVITNEDLEKPVHASSSSVQ